MRAIICDDDEIILKGLGTVIDWAALGVEIAGTAGDGKEGMRLLRKQKPDLLMTDIRMPHVDGLSLIEEGKKLNPDMAAIVFSGYDDFMYARKALKLGVRDYLTKPIDVDELSSLVLDCVRRFEEARKHHFSGREDLLRRLLMYEEIDKSQLTGLEHDFCMVMIFETEKDTGLMAQGAARLRDQGAYILIQKESRCELAITSRSRMSVEMRGDFCASHMRKLFGDRAIPLTSAVSSIWEGVEMLGRCYEEAHEALKLRYVRGDNQSLHYSDTVERRDGGDALLILDTDLITPVKNGNSGQLEQAMEELEERLEQAGMDSYLYMQLMVGNLYSSVLRELGSWGISVDLVFENPVEEYKRIIQCGTAQKALEALGDNLRRICRYVDGQKSGAYSKPVYKAMQYMERNYGATSLSLEDAAEAAGLSAARLSTSFKSETGMAFTDYLVRLRMEKAKGLMRNPNMKIYEIAMACGYENIPYFSTAFKRYTGCTPSEYRGKLGR